MILVFGSINLDLVARVPRLPRPGETLAGEHFSAQPGGKGANQALAAQRAGGRVAMAGAVGNDAFATTALASLAAGGVDLALVRHVPAATGVALIHVDDSGENSITVIAGANAHADADDVPAALLRTGNTVLLQLEVPLPAVCTLARRAHEAGARVILNAAPANTLPPDIFEALDVLVVNELEADVIATTLGVPTLPEAFAAGVHRRFGFAVVVTLGAQGALAVAGGEWLRVPAPAVDVRDTTGAGDAFTGALAVALDRGDRWPQALAEGVAAGSLACTGEGAQAALPVAAAIHCFAENVQPQLVSSPLR
ncbi:MAG: ribokinase [Betaproteobacteria bacterium]